MERRVLTEVEGLEQNTFLRIPERAKALDSPFPERSQWPSVSEPDDRVWMRRALDLAKAAAEMGEVPVGAVMVCEGRLVSQAFNLRETLHDPTAHAERLALELAGRALTRWRLDCCSLYVTLEPCAMCAGAIVQARLRRVIFGCPDRKAGACTSLYRIVSDPRLNHRAEVLGGILELECQTLLSDFFQERRNRSAFER